MVHCALCMVLLGLSMSVISCKDDDDEKSEEQERQEAQQKADAFWDVVGQLTSTDNYTADYRDKTFEPTIGEPLEGNNTVRVVATNDMASAAARFASLVGVSIDANTSNYTYSNDDVGTLTYTKTDNGQSWATVDVNIKQLPKLQQIIYRSPEQGGTNASKKGTCYYRFGDVVKKTYKDKDDDNKEKTEYWVCVRPAFNPEGKGDSHWITVSQLPKKNVWTYKTKDGQREFALPTGIGKNEEHMQNLAEMLFAITHSDEWEQNVLNNPAPGIFSSGLRMFHDFSHDPDMVKYHSAKFWERVKKAWTDEKLGISNLLFGQSLTELEQAIVGSNSQSKGLYLLVKGYSWWTSTSWNLSLYQYRYENGQGKESNMHKVTGMTEIKKNVEKLQTPINVMNSPYITNNDFFGSTEARFIIRHATGKELAGFQPDIYETMQTNNNGITEVYTYNDYYYNRNNISAQNDPETSDNIINGYTGHSLVDLGLSFEGNQLGDSIFPTIPAPTIRVECSWKPNAKKKNFTLYAFAFPKGDGEKKQLGECNITTASDQTIRINFEGLAEGDYVLCLTDNEEGKDPCAYAKNFRMEKPQFTLEWEDVPTEMIVSQGLKKGKLKATLTNFNELTFTELHEVYKDLTAGEFQLLHTNNNVHFKKGEAISFNVKYIVQVPRDFAWVLSTDEEGKEVVIERTIKGKAPSKAYSDVTKDDLFSIVGNNGRIYPSMEVCQAAEVRPVAMIVAVPWESEEKNQKVLFCTYEGSSYYEREGLRNPQTADEHVGLKHAMAIPIKMSSTQVNFDACTYQEAFNRVKKEWNEEGHDFYIKGDLSWKLPSVYLTLRMMNYNLTSDEQPNESPNLARWKAERLLDPKTKNNAADNRYGWMTPYGSAVNNLKLVCPYVYMPETFWMDEYVIYDEKAYRLAMHHDSNYPSNSKLFYYYFPTRENEEMGFMPVLVW